MSPQVRGLRHLSPGAVRGPARGGDIPADQIFREQRCQLHPRHPRCVQLVQLSTSINRTISDSRMKFVAHERFQYVLLNKFGKLLNNVIINNRDLGCGVVNVQ